MADKKINNLDDLEKALKQVTEEAHARRREERQRAQEKKRQRWMLFREEGRILLIPLLVIILMIVIVIADRDGGTQQPEAVSEQVSEQQTDLPDTELAADPTVADSTEETETTEDPTLVREYYDNTLEDFFAAYFDARLNQDTDTLFRMTGVTGYTEAQTEALRAQLKTQAGYIEAYQDIKLYAVNALEDYSKLVFITYNVKFRRVDTLAPGIMYCYVRVNDQNSYEIVENMQPEQVRFVNEYTTSHTEVTELIDATNSRLLQALSSDQRLAVVYDAFMTGRIYTEEQSVIDSEVSLIQVETEPQQTETVAETEAGTVVDTETDPAVDIQEEAAVNTSEDAGGAASQEETEEAETEASSEATGDGAASAVSIAE